MKKRIIKTLLGYIKKEHSRLEQLLQNDNSPNQRIIESSTNIHTAYLLLHKAVKHNEYDYIQVEDKYFVELNGKRLRVY